MSGPKPGGETFECHFYITAQKDWPAITFGVQSDYSGGAQRNYNNVSLRGDLRLAVDSNQLDSTNVDKSTGFVGGWSRFEVTWNSNGDITAEVFDTTGASRATVSGNDSTYGQGGIGFGMNNYNGVSSTSYFDLYQQV